MIPQISIVDIIRFKRKHFRFKTENKDFYVLTCRIHGESLFFYNDKEYLAKRNIDEKIIKDFRIGLSLNDTTYLYNVLTQKYDLNKLDVTKRIQCIKETKRMTNIGSKRARHTPVVRLTSIMDKLDYRLRKESEARKKRKVSKK